MRGRVLYRQSRPRAVSSFRSPIEKPGSRGSFPLDSARRFARNVKHDAVDFRHLVDDAVGDAGDRLVGQTRPIRGHGISAHYRADRDDILVGTGIAHHADALRIGQHREALPKLFVETRVLDLIDNDPIGGAQGFQASDALPRP